MFVIWGRGTGRDYIVMVRIERMRMVISVKISFILWHYANEEERYSLSLQATIGIAYLPLLFCFLSSSQSSSGSSLPNQCCHGRCGFLTTCHPNGTFLSFFLCPWYFSHCALHIIDAQYFSFFLFCQGKGRIGQSIATAVQQLAAGKR